MTPEATLEMEDTQQTQDGAPPPVLLNIADIRLDGGTQLRVAGLNEKTVVHYMERLQEDDKLPAVRVYRDNDGNLWLACGFHRLEAYKRLERTQILAEVWAGSQREAILYAAEANTKHGLQLTDADKENAVLTLLRDAEWSQWADRAIAKHARVSPTFVGKLRKELGASIRRGQIAGGKPAPAAAPTATRTVTRCGQTYTMKTDGIGKKRAAAEKAASPPEGEGKESSEERYRREMAEARVAAKRTNGIIEQHHRDCLEQEKANGATDTPQDTELLRVDKALAYLSPEQSEARARIVECAREWGCAARRHRGTWEATDQLDTEGAVDRAKEAWKAAQAERQRVLDDSEATKEQKAVALQHVKDTKGAYEQATQTAEHLWAEHRRAYADVKNGLIALHAATQHLLELEGHTGGLPELLMIADMITATAGRN